jgi:dipeptidase E
MKLYLSSYRIPTKDFFCDLLDNPVQDCSIAIITNAKDYREPVNAKQRIADLAGYLSEFGFKKVELLDVRKFDHTPEAFVEFIQAYDVLYAIGGSQFGLVLAFEETGLKDAFIKLLREGKVYAGESAGAMLLGEELDLDDDKEEKAEVPRVITKGLRVIPYSILPHADSEYKGYGERMRRVYETYAEKNKLLILNDNQAFVMNNDDGRIVTGQYQEML